MEILTVHYNTQEATDAMIRSVNKHVHDCTIHVFDNSDTRPFVNTFDNVEVIDNTQGQIIDFDYWLQRYPDRQPRISNSTFSWWGAYLNANAEKVVCPWPWFEGNKIDPMTNILPKEWIKWTM